MSRSPVTKGTRQKRSEIVSNILQGHNTVQNSVVFHNVSKPSPVLSDRREFPSLNENAEKESSNSQSASILTYSDKLKSKSLPNNQNTVSDIQSKRDTVVSNTLNQQCNSHNSKPSVKWNPTAGRSTFNKRDKNQNQAIFDKTRFINKIDVNPSLNDPRKLLIQSPKECNLNHQLSHVHQKELSKQKPLENSINVNLVSSNNQTRCNKSVKFRGERGELKEENVSNVQNKEKKKKRKSKVKRQVALQSGKITVLTQEVHLKILNQTNAITSHSSKSIFTDINDEEEYPELGKPFLQLSQKGNNSKKDIEPSKETADKPTQPCTEDKIPVNEINKESSVINISEKPASEKKGKCDAKTTVHPKDPITVSFYDILLNKNTTPNIVKDEINIPSNIGHTKMKMKKDTSRPHNLLDSSSPFVKRGKEREKPKPKKPSQLKKIILLDRKIRKEHLLNSKTSNPAESYADAGEFVNKLNADELDETDATETNYCTENKSNDIGESTNQTLLLMSDNSSVCTSYQEITSDQTLMLLTDNEDEGEDDLIPEVKQLSVSETTKLSTTENHLSTTNTLSNNVKEKDFLDNSLLPPDKICKNKNNSSAMGEAISSRVSYSSDLLNNLLKNEKKSEVSDKERAAKILLHTRNFREYCNHLISKDIDDVVFSLLDDLARFQDRLHQKDPVKARMKRRMINGIKEVKKHIKLRKLKCIIIAVDIENVETQGGLNDILNDIKTSAAEHFIPCVFALSRKVLGKVCRKPVPVSCVGVLNFEGSEVNFKKMVELQSQSKADYNEIFSKLALKLTDEEASVLLKAKTEAPETLRTIRADILNDFFRKSKTGCTENEDIDLKSNQMSDIET